MKSRQSIAFWILDLSSLEIIDNERGDSLYAFREVILESKQE